MDVQCVGSVTVDWSVSSVKGQMWEKGLLRESESLLSMLSISSLLSFNPYNSETVMLSFYRQKSDSERLSNVASTQSK